MTIYYVDFTNGNDSNSGTSFANRKQTVTSASASTVAGDSIRIMGSPAATNMGQNATFTNQSNTVTLTSAVTQNVYNDGAWTASTNVTCTADTGTLKEGSNSSKNVITSSFTTGIISYFNTGTLNLSGYQQISFWIRANSNLSASKIKLRLSSTTGGTTATHEFTVTTALNSTHWTVLTYNLGSNMSSSIASVALVALSAPGSITIWIDDIIACKSTSSVDSLTLNSLIGKNDGFWWPIQSINGTTVLLDGHPEDGIGTSGQYYGTTATTTAYKRECIQEPFNGFNPSTGGSAGNPITISGGWDMTAMSSQSLDGTYIDWRDADEIGATIAENYINLSYCSFYRCSFGLEADSSYCSYSNINVGACSSYGIAVGITSTNKYNNSYSNINAVCCFRNIQPDIGLIFLQGSTWNNIYSISSVSGSGYLEPGYNEIWTNVYTYNHQGIGFYIQSVGLTVYNLTAAHNTSYGIEVANVTDPVIYGLTTFNNTSGAVGVFNSGKLSVINPSLGEGDAISSTDAGQLLDQLWLQYDGGVDTTHKGLFVSGSITSDITTRHVSAGFAWKFSPIDDTVFVSGFPLTVQVAYVPIAANTTRTISVWCYKNSSNITQTIRIKGGRIPGIGSVGTDITATNSGSANQWNEITLASITPTVDCIVEVYNECYSTDNVSSCWTHDILVS